MPESLPAAILRAYGAAMDHEETKFSHWVKNVLIIGALALLAVGVIFYQEASGQVEAVEDGPSVQTPQSKTPFTGLTQEELSWLLEHPVIRVVQDPRWPPVEFADERGNPSGISNDYLSLVEQRLGVKFEKVRDLSWQQAYSQLKRWDIDMTTCVAETQERREFWAFTRPYISIPIVILAHADVTYIGNMRELDGKKVAVVAGYVAKEWIQRDFPNIQLVGVNSVKEGLDLLQEKQVFAFVDNMLVIGYYLAKLKLVNFKIAGATPYVNAQCMAVRKDWAVLAGILQKALDSISEAERAQIYQNWVPIRYEYGFDYNLLWQALGIFAVVLAALLVWNGMLSKEIKSRKEAEAALRESEEKYRLLFEKGKDAFVIHEVESMRFVDANPAAEALWGYTKTELRTMTPVDLSLEPQKTIEALEDAAKPGGGGTQVPIRWQKKKDGSSIAVEISASHSFTWKNRNVLCSVVKDVTDRKKAEEALRSEREQLLSIFESINEVILVISPQTYEILYANKFTEDLYGKKLRGGNCYEVLNSLCSPCYHCSMERIMELEGKPYQWEYHNPILNKDFLATDRMIRWSDGLQVKFQIAVDITERNLAESEKESLRNQLLQAQKMEAIGTLAGGIAHDFNNLLQVTLGYSELLLEGKTLIDPDYADLKKIHQAAGSGAELVRNLLTFGRKVEPNFKPLDLNQCVSQVEKILSRTVPKMIDIHLKLGEDIERTNADPAQIQQVIINLAVNAKDAMGEEGCLTIQTENVTLDDAHFRLNVEAKPGDYVLLSISDTGHGMDAQTLQHIFEPFYTTKELGRGTGLGLAMVYGIVIQHGGHITCHSEVGKGTTFKLYFPAIPSIQEPAAEETGIMPAFGTETVLLVDDEELVRELGRRILAKNGFTVLTAGNGEEALDIYGRDKQRIALVILDLIMPTLGGKDCLKKILQIDPHAKVLIASGYSGDASAKECVELGAKGFVAKPFRFKELLQQVHKALDTR